ncbi:MAG: hypothetical protein JW814_07200 [Candidatus Krumholzibacteriota bacterium]|nr:hypothetical protein [Candidatus Krumholzibacteriota bacterium]
MVHNKLTKHDLKEDGFVTFVLGAWEYVRENQNKFFIGLIALIVVVASSIWVSNSRKQANEQAQIQFSEAVTSFRNGQIKSAEELFRIVDERFSNTREGVFSAYFAGKCALIDGRNTEAVELFGKYLKKADKYPFFREAAMDGMATAYSNERNYDMAAGVYTDLIKRIGEGSFEEKVYLRKAADSMKMAGRNTEAIGMLERLLKISTGIERRDIQIELDFLRG